MGGDFATTAGTGFMFLFFAESEADSQEYNDMLITNIEVTFGNDNFTVYNSLIFILVF
ncbi:hypothetical protein DJ66_0499 [Candidatus Liberibacter solanacearum]|uniref:Uncharacterized protein n=1 Tax=Candidatus Liberibacter solanacearum TaxID=556287 RepID=A0A0F4VKK6_9HYPH|nr:hypothetical protein DJ66_0499 [Candidatus Liberibacter solanacearum]